MKLKFFMVDKAIRRISRTYRLLLFYIFHFDKWHISPLSERKYAQDIIGYLNSLEVKNRKAVVEIGCGLGDIIRHLKFKNRFGFDRDNNAIRAAQYLSRCAFNKKIYFHTFTFPISKLNGKYNVIILVNWIHDITPEILKENLEGYFKTNLIQNGIIVIDTVEDKEYKFNHSINFLTNGLKCKIVQLGNYERQREVFSIIKID